MNSLIGVPTFQDDDPPWFYHGKEFESEARGRYAWERGVEVEEVGFVVHPDLPFVGCSPDGFIVPRGGMVPKGGIEIKVRSSLKSFLPISGLSSTHKPQVQGCLWITGMEYWDYINYCPLNGGKMRVDRVYPDLEYHKRLFDACNDTWDRIQKEVEAWKKET